MTLRTTWVVMCVLATLAPPAPAQHVPDETALPALGADRADPYCGLESWTRRIHRRSSPSTR